MDRWKNEKVRRGVGMGDNICVRVDCKVSKQLRYVERVSGKRLTKRVYESEVEGRSDRNRSQKRWLHVDQKRLKQGHWS